MRRFKIRVSILFISMFLFSSCSLRGNIAFLRARFLSSRAQQTPAIAILLDFVEDETLGPWAAYELGSLYLSMGETGSAKRQLHTALSRVFFDTASLDDRYRSLAFNSFFNLGFAEFKDRDFYAAAQAFRQALTIEPLSFDAKKNLELALAAQRQEEAQAGSKSRAQQGGNFDAGLRRLIDFLQEGEQRRWESSRWQGEEKLWPDY